MASYEVYLYNLPKVSDDGKELLSKGSNETKSFGDKGQATTFASGKKDAFERIIVMEVDDSNQKLVERYRDGSHESAQNIVRR